MEQYKKVNRSMLVHAIAAIATPLNGELYSHHQLIINVLNRTRDIAKDKITPEKILKRFSALLETSTKNQIRVNAFLEDSEKFMNELENTEIYTIIVNGLYMHTPLRDKDGYHDGDWSTFPFLKKSIPIGMKNIKLILSKYNRQILLTNLKELEYDNF